MDPAHTPCGHGQPPSSFIAQELGQASGAKSYARWNALETQTFIAACEIAIAEGHRSGRCFTKQGWARISTLFNSATGHNWTKQQLRNHWDAMRRTYRRLSDLLKGSGVEYNESTGRVIASEEWWNRKIKKNKEYREFKDKNVSEIYIRYRTLFGDSYDGEKYAVTPTKLCRTGFGLFEDSALKDTRDAIPVNEESGGSSDEAEQMLGGSRLNVSDTTSGGKRKSSGATRRGKKKKTSARELSFSVDRATSAAEEVVAKLNTMMGSNDNTGTACIEELLAAGRLERRTLLYFFACAILAKKHYRNMLAVMKDVDKKFEWIEWLFNERGK